MKILKILSGTKQEHLLSESKVSGLTVQVWEKDDIIQKVNDIQIKNAQALTDEIRKFKPKTKVKITLLREGKEKVLETELEQR